MSFAALLNGVSGAFGLKASDKLPSYLATKDGVVPRNFQSENWYAPTNEGPYQFAVESVDISEAGLNPIGKFVATVTSLFGEGGEFTEFNLPISPSEIMQSEDFAVAIKPTQGGTVVQHSGNKYKTLTLSGTTGVAPFRGQLGVNALTGLAIGQPDDLKFRSGYEVFQHFRAWMKSYHQAKAQGGAKNKLRMIFRNFKDWEFTYVEPIKFIMKRDAQKPLLYNYTIQFRVLGHVKPATPLFPFLDSIDNVLNKAAKAINAGRHILVKTKDLIVAEVGEISALLDNVRRIKSAIAAAQRLPLNFGDIPREVIKKHMSRRDSLALADKIGNVAKNIAADTKAYEAQGVDLSTTPEDPAAYGEALQAAVALSPDDVLAIVLAALADMGDAVDTIEVGDSLPESGVLAALQAQLADALISRQEIEDIQAQLDDLSSKFANAIGLESSEFNEIYGVITEDNASNTTEVTDQQFEAVYGFRQISQGIDMLLSNDQLFDGNAALFNQNDSTNGAESIGQGIFSFPSPDAGTKQGVVPSGATLEAIALAELGDSNRWTEVAELNNLKSPYIDDSAEGQFTVNYKPRYRSFSDPALIQDLQVNYMFIVTKTPTPSNGWINKENFIAEYIGGDQSLVTSWRFIYPQDGSVAEIQETGELVQFSTVAEEWSIISSDTLQADGVLRPGDQILIPTTAVPPPRTLIRGPRDNALTNGLSNSEKALGVDLRITSEGDLDLQPNGDLGVALGLVNGAQAVALKIIYDKGSLVKFPSVGTSIGVGKKVPNVAEIRQQLFSSLIQDDRIEDVSKINLIRVNGTIEVSFEVKFVDLQDPIPITLPV